MSQHRSKSRRCHRAAFPRYSFTPGATVKTVCKPPRKEEDFYQVIDEDLAEPEDTRFQLGRNLIPLNYLICLKPNLERMTFEGCVAIRCAPPEETPSITLNALGLDITKVIWVDEVTNRRSTPFQHKSSTLDQRLTITFDPPLVPNPGNLIINFSGIFDAGANAAGFSRHSLGNARVLINKLAEARKYFPCFDEPSFKATFGLSFIIPKTMTVVSNMPIKIIYPHRSDKNLHSVEFETTPKMSPHLLAFAIGNFTFIEERIQDLPCRIYDLDGPVGYSGKFVFETCRRLLSYFTDFFDIPFPLKKFDMVAEKNSTTLASDSWGLSVLNKGKILVSDENADANINVRIGVIRSLANVVCKQWLGNLITPKCWTHSWLFESLGTFLEYRSIDRLDPSYEVWTHFLTDIYTRALDLDALSASHLIEVQVNHPSELSDSFDSFSRTKGVAILRMLEAYIGPTKFQQGLTSFVKKYAYGNATTSDFWSTLEEVSGKPIRVMMMSWSKQITFPVVRVVSTHFENNCRHVTLRQDSFYAESTPHTPPRHTPTDKPNGLWIIPITVSVGAQPNQVAKEILMDKREISFKLTRIGETEWFKLNFGTTGYYRVKYSPEMHSQFRQAIRQERLPEADKFGLLSDVYAFASSGIGGCGDVFTLLEALEDEEDLGIWTLIDSVITRIDLLLHTTDYYFRFLAFVRSIYKNVQTKRGWEGSQEESYSTTKLRHLVIRRLLISGDEKCAEVGGKRFENFMSGQTFLPAELPNIYVAGMQEGDIGAIRAMTRRSRMPSTDAQEREAILESLGFCKNKVGIQEILKFSISTTVKRQETIIIFKSFASNVKGREMAWEFFKEHPTVLSNRFMPEIGLLREFLGTVTEPFSAEEMALEISEFFRVHHHLFSGCERTISQSLEKIRNSAAWLKREKTHMSEYLAKFE